MWPFDKSQTFSNWQQTEIRLNVCKDTKANASMAQHSLKTWFLLRDLEYNQIKLHLDHFRRKVNEESGFYDVNLVENIYLSSPSSSLSFTPPCLSNHMKVVNHEHFYLVLIILKARKIFQKAMMRYIFMMMREHDDSLWDEVFLFNEHS
jgi:hypothetical protein